MLNSKTLIQIAIVSSFLTPSFSIYAEESITLLPPSKDLIVKADSTVYDPNVLTLDSIRLYEQRFNYDWNDYSTIELNKNKTIEIEKFSQSNPNIADLNKEDKRAYGRLLYKLGTYYTHITRETNIAIQHMKEANLYLGSKEEKAWNENHLAYAYEIKFSEQQDNKDKDQAFKYTNHVIAIYSKSKNKIIAFAYCIKGLLENDSKNFGYAEENFKQALDIYEHLPDGKDDQYSRTKSRLAEILLFSSDRDNEALTILQEQEAYWNNKHNLKQNPYAARNLVLLSEAHMKLNNPNDAIIKLKQSIEIFQTVFGNHSAELIKPYQLLTEAYAKTDNTKLMELYQSKLNALIKEKPQQSKQIPQLTTQASK